MSGLIDAHWHALLVDDDPTAGLTSLADPTAKLKIIMKDGRIYKSTLGA